MSNGRDLESTAAAAGYYYTVQQCAAASNTFRANNVTATCRKKGARFCKCQMVINDRHSNKEFAQLCGRFPSIIWNDRNCTKIIWVGWIAASVKFVYIGDNWYDESDSLNITINFNFLDGLYKQETGGLIALLISTSLSRSPIYESQRWKMVVVGTMCGPPPIKNSMY
jgi:predicted ATPase